MKKLILLSAIMVIASSSISSFAMLRSGHEAVAVCARAAALAAPAAVKSAAASAAPAVARPAAAACAKCTMPVTRQMLSPHAGHVQKFSCKPDDFKPFCPSPAWLKNEVEMCVGDYHFPTVYINILSSPEKFAMVVSGCPQDWKKLKAEIANVSLRRSLMSPHADPASPARAADDYTRTLELLDRNFRRPLKSNPQIPIEKMTMDDYNREREIQGISGRMWSRLMNGKEVRSVLQMREILDSSKFLEYGVAPDILKAAKEHTRNGLDDFERMTADADKK